MSGTSVYWKTFMQFLFESFSLSFPVEYSTYSKSSFRTSEWRSSFYFFKNIEPQSKFESNTYNNEESTFYVSVQDQRNLHIWLNMLKRNQELFKDMEREQVCSIPQMKCKNIPIKRLKSNSFKHKILSKLRKRMLTANIFSMVLILK